MMTKNTPFFSDVVTFFSVLLPGCAAVLLLLYKLDGPFPTAVQHSLGNSSVLFALAFFTLAYFLGQIINQVGSLLDKHLYDRFKASVFSNNQRLNQVKIIHATQSPGNASPLYASHFEWAYARLCREYAQAASDVERKMADSIFFRSFVVVWLLALLVFATKNTWDWVALSVLFLMISLAAYFLLRRQGTESAYKGVLLLDEAVFHDEKTPLVLAQIREQEEQALTVEQPPEKYQELLARFTQDIDRDIAFVQISAQKQGLLTLPLDKNKIQLLCLQGGGYLSTVTETG